MVNGYMFIMRRGVCREWEADGEWVKAVARDATTAGPSVKADSVSVPNAARKPLTGREYPVHLLNVRIVVMS